MSLLDEIKQKSQVEFRPAPFASFGGFLELYVSETFDIQPNYPPFDI